MQGLANEAGTTLFLLQEKLELRYLLLERELAASAGDKEASARAISKFKEFEDLAKDVACIAKDILNGEITKENQIKQQELLRKIKDL